MVSLLPSSRPIRRRSRWSQVASTAPCRRRRARWSSGRGVGGDGHAPLSSVSTVYSADRPLRPPSAASCTARRACIARTRRVHRAYPPPGRMRPPRAPPHGSGVRRRTVASAVQVSDVGHCRTAPGRRRCGSTAVFSRRRRGSPTRDTIGGPPGRAVPPHADAQGVRGHRRPSRPPRPVAVRETSAWVVPSASASACLARTTTPGAAPPASSARLWAHGRPGLALFGRTSHSSWSRASALAELPCATADLARLAELSRRLEALF